MAKPEDESGTLTRFDQGAVVLFGVEVDLHVNHGHDIPLQMIRKYKNPLFDVTKPLNVQFIVAGGYHKGVVPDGITLLKGSLGPLCPKHDHELLLSDMFIIMGKMILHAVLNNYCQGISCTSPTTVRYNVTHPSGINMSRTSH